MPKELFILELWLRYAEKASEIRVKRYEETGMVKLKARLGKYLYTIRLPTDMADKAIEELKGKGKGIVDV